MAERYAIYYAPATTDPLWISARSWLERDAATQGTGKIAAGFDPSRRPALTRSADRYGFHATLKPPMALAAGTNLAGFTAAVAAFARGRPPVSIGPMMLSTIDGFLALVPERQSAALTGFAADCVTHFEPFRAPPGEEERQRRLAGSRLTPRQIELIDTYGYPFVLDQFRFHMTLSDRLAPDEMEAVRGAAARWFGPHIGVDRTLDRLVIFRESAPGLSFERLGEYLLGGRG